MLPASDPFAFVGNGPGMVMFRQGQFQAQLFICTPYSKVPPHAHPNVDSFEMHLGGDLYFYVDGQATLPIDHLHDRRGAASRWWGRGVRVKRGQTHHLDVGQNGGAFMSIQHWLNDVKPTSVDFDWEGAPMDARHLEGLSAVIAREVAAKCDEYEAYEPYIAGQLCS